MSFYTRNFVARGALWIVNPYYNRTQELLFDLSLNAIYFLLLLLVFLYENKKHFYLRL